LNIYEPVFFSFTKGPASNTFSDLLLYCDFSSVFSTVKKYTVAAINPEFFSSYFSMTQHRLKTSYFIEAKTNLQRYISRIIVFIKTAVSDSLDPGPQALAGFRHGVPVEGPHHLLDLLDQILGFVARLCNDPYFRFAQHEKTKKISIRRAGRTDLLLQHLRNSALNGVSKRF
jgi:hypothetical protein